MSDPHAPYRALRNTDRRIAEGLYRLECQRRHLDQLRRQRSDAGQAAGQLLMLEAELASLRSERDRLIRALTQPAACGGHASTTPRASAPN